MLDKLLNRARRLGRKAAWLFHRIIGRPTHRYHCPVCDRAVRRWLPLERWVGEGRHRDEREGRLCPHCGSFERTRHYWLWLVQERLLESKPRFLHFAPEHGLMKRLRTELGSRYLTTDIAMPEADQLMDITRLELADVSFDHIYCSNVLEHVTEDRKALGELYRVLAPGGVAIIQVPIKGETTYEDTTITSLEERARLFGQADHVRYYGRDIQARLRQAGFKVVEFVMLDVLQLEAGAVERQNLGKREFIYSCEKPRN